MTFCKFLPGNCLTFGSHYEVYPCSLMSRIYIRDVQPFKKPGQNHVALTPRRDHGGKEKNVLSNVSPSALQRSLPAVSHLYTYKWKFSFLDSLPKAGKKYMLFVRLLFVSLVGVDFLRSTLFCFFLLTRWCESHICSKTFQNVPV